MKNENRIEVFSNYQFLKLILLRFVLAGSIAYCITIFNQNEVAIGLIILLLLLLLFTAGIDKIILFEDRFEHISDSLLKIFRKKRTWYYKDIKSVSVNGSFNKLTDILMASDLWNKMYIELKNDSTITINSYIYISKLKGVCERINQALSHK